MPKTRIRAQRPARDAYMQLIQRFPLKKIKNDPTLDAQTKQELARAARDRLFGGFRENCWLLLTRGRDYQLEPKAIAPVTVVG